MDFSMFNCGKINIHLTDFFSIFLTSTAINKIVLKSKMYFFCISNFHKYLIDCMTLPGTDKYRQD